LNSGARPHYFTRSYGTEKEDYDPVHLGWKVKVLRHPSKLPPNERRRIYDTTLPGRSNSGHAFGDKFTEEERMAVIEYLKTLQEERRCRNRLGLGPWTPQARRSIRVE